MQTKTPETLSRSGFSSVADPARDPHVNGEYFKKNPSWHVEYSPWKAGNILELMKRKNIRPKSVCEVGCGAGEVLRQMQLKMDPSTSFWGCDVAPAAIDLAKTRENDRLKFECVDFGMVETPRFDVLLALEVVDHVEDYFGFLRSLKDRSEWKVFSFSLDINVQAVLRQDGLMQRRREHSHMHHFSKETALDALRYTGFEIVDYFHPANLAISKLARLARPLRVLTFKMNEDLTVRMFGGYSLVVLAR